MANKQQVSEFFKTDVPAFGSYDNCRKIASYIDGLKISMRKILFTMMKKYPGKDKTKTENVANIVAATTNYLHGAQNLCGVCDTMAQNFVGSNNYNLLDGNSGGFGTRIGGGVCAAPRYTKIALSEIVRKLFIETDSKIIDQQFFEGDYIEPLFFVPIFPVTFLNGSSGLSTGFSQDILPRNPSEIIEYIKKKLNGVEKPRMQLLPWFKGHLGKVAWNEELQRNESYGVITYNNMTSYTISELPIGTEYQKYVEFLDKLCENGTIQDYDDKCDPKTDKILFNIKTTREFTRKIDSNERKLYETLHLVKSLPEVLCCIDESNRVKEYNSIYEILDDFITLRLKYYQKRKDWLVDDLKQKLTKLASKYYFVKGVVDGTIIVSKRKKDDVVKQLEKIDKICKIDGSYDYLLAMQISSLTAEKMEELKKLIEEGKEEYKTVKSTTIQDMWLGDLRELKKIL